ncbi:MAG TPA: DNA/RNA nuclease SfsA [Dongiaceae bacterium]
MLFPTPLIPSRLLRRYKRFLADVILPDGSEAIVHCPNPGSMLGLAEPGTICWLRDHRGSNRKLPFGWELTELADSGKPGRLVGINTGLANAIVAEALAERRVSAFAGYDAIRREVQVGSKSRLDFQLDRHVTGEADQICYLEVKSVTLGRQAGLAEFPDSRTARGARHLLELAALAAAGHRAVLLFLVQRDDCDRVRCAGDIDPWYQATLRQLAGAVEIRAYGCDIRREDGRPVAITLTDEMPVEDI